MSELTPTQPRRLVTAQSAARRVGPRARPYSRRTLLMMTGAALFVPMGLVLLLRMSERRRATAVGSTTPVPAAPAIQAPAPPPAAGIRVVTPPAPDSTPSYVLVEVPPFGPEAPRSLSRRRRPERSSQRFAPTDVPTAAAENTSVATEEATLEETEDTPTDLSGQPDASPAEGRPESRDESNPYIYKSTEGTNP